jgi:hypothetical protein
MNSLAFILFIGIGATAVMDLWALARKPLLGITPPDYGLVSPRVCEFRGYIPTYDVLN